MSEGKTLDDKEFFDHYVLYYKRTYCFNFKKYVKYIRELTKICCCICNTVCEKEKIINVTSTILTNIYLDELKNDLNSNIKLLLNVNSQLNNKIKNTQYIFIICLILMILIIYDKIIKH